MMNMDHLVFDFSIISGSGKKCGILFLKKFMFSSLFKSGYTFWTSY